MQTSQISTSFRKFGRGSALAVLVAVATAIVLLVAFSFGGEAPIGATSTELGDAALYARIVDRLRHGENYYSAAHIELLTGHYYPTLSVFNWRTPLLMSLVALAPSTLWAQIVLATITLIAGAMGVYLVNREGNLDVAGPLACLLIVSLCTSLVPGAVLFGEVVGGVLILASCCCYGLRLWLPGMLLALLALFVRELAAPYVVICLGLALLQGRRGELALGIAGLAAYAVYFLFHMHAVAAQLGPDDMADPSGGWIAFGGLHFLAGTAASNGAFVLAPVWISAALLPVAFLGLCAFPSGARMAMTVAAYAMLFCIAGKPFNVYWGALYTPLLSFGLVWAPFALRDLLTVARDTSESQFANAG
ncbi:hypothetical protein [Hyphomicrobium sp.]|uniref:hypothetical protein n=1 Tax=Hyphomicrobium sp. TaxID=82 RepID=UPI000FA388D9|nr:hypothetical protein [Hyphomicrobium sp.]RUP09347.1 MAG: hypothetical protein EKK38_08220 [Hyphomicrobium sp.]